MGLEENITGTLSDDMRSCLGEAEYANYVQALQTHLHTLKYHRYSDEPSLCWLRKAMYLCNAVALNTRGDWRIDRSAEEYSQAFNMDIGAKIRGYVIDQRASGANSPYEPVRVVDEGAGNCWAAYTAAEPGAMITGTGLELSFSLEGTLRNCLRPQYRFSPGTYRQPALMSRAFQKLIDSFDATSILVLLLKRNCSLSSDQSRTYSSLRRTLDELESSETVHLSKLGEIQEQLDSLVPAHQISDVKEDVAAFWLYSLMIDETVGRLAVPNGVGFWYAELDLCLRKLLSEGRSWSSEEWWVGNGYESWKHGMQELHEYSRRTESDDSNRQAVPLATWHTVASIVAQETRDSAFKARENGVEDETVGVLLDISNTLWRWVFFVRQEADVFYDLSTTDEHVATLLTWLDHPWGILRLEDMDRLYLGLVEQEPEDDLPSAMGIIAGFGRMDVLSYLVTRFGFRTKESARTLLTEFLEPRVRMLSLRQHVKHIENDDPASHSELDKVHFIIDSCCAWPYQNGGSREFKRVARDIRSLPSVLTRGKWARKMMGSCDVPLTETQLRELRRFLASPEAFVREYFTLLDEEHDTREQIDVYLVDEFVYLRF